MLRTITMSVVLCGLAMAANADAFIGGKASANGKVETGVAVAIGSNANAVNGIGAIAGNIRSGGSLSVNGRANTAVAVAIASGARAYNTIGSVTGDVTLSGGSVSGATGTAIAVGIGNLVCTSTMVGSISSANHCKGGVGLF